MQYREDRDRTAEILRLALPLMARQEAGFHPASYALWYEHAAGINPALSQLLEQRLAAEKPLTEADVTRLHAQYIVQRDIEGVERIRQRLLDLLQQTSQMMSDTGTHAVQFGDALDEHAARLKEPNPADSMRAIVDELLVETQQMCSATVAMARRMESNAQEVQTLTDRLEEVQAEAFKDPLTGLLNRRGFESAVADLPAGTSLADASLLLIDVDHFKVTNDTHGHLLGDQVLRAIAQVLRARIKGADIAARMGGDEFAVLLPDTAMAGALALAEQIRTTVPYGRLRRIDGKDIDNITLSLGVAHGISGEQLDNLIQRADAALYAAKRSGRNRVIGDDPDRQADPDHQGINRSNSGTI
jgi:diguanylate cyclase